MDDNQNGVYYQPPQLEQNAYQPPPPKKGMGVKIAVAIIVLLLAVAVVGGAFYIPTAYKQIKNTAGGNDLFSDSGDIQITGECSFPADDVSSLDIEWIAGEISIIYYDGDLVTVTESSNNESKPMCCTLEKGKLSVEYFLDDEGFNLNRSKINTQKDLLISIPHDKYLSEIDMEVVSSDISMNDIICGELDLSTVGGDASFTFMKQPDEVEINSVGGNVSLGFADDISGYNVDFKTVSGKLDDRIKKSGDGRTKISFESVGGSLKIYQVEK